MNIYIVLIQDSHSDPDTIAFKDREEAISYAKEWALSHSKNPDYLTETKIKGWEFYCQYGVESDTVTVLKRELQ